MSGEGIEASVYKCMDRWIGSRNHAQITQSIFDGDNPNRADKF